MIALSSAAGVASMASSNGLPLTHGVSSAGLHIPGAASLAKIASRVARASGVRYQLISGHAVDVLFADGDTAATGAVFVGEVAVGVEAVSQLVGELGELVGAKLGAQTSQLPSAFSRSRRQPSRAAGR